MGYNPSEPLTNLAHPSTLPPIMHAEDRRGLEDYFSFGEAPEFFTSMIVGQMVAPTFPKQAPCQWGTSGGGGVGAVPRISCLFPFWCTPFLWVRVEKRASLRPGCLVKIPKGENRCISRLKLVLAWLWFPTVRFLVLCPLFA